MSGDGATPRPWQTCEASTPPHVPAVRSDSVFMVCQMVTGTRERMEANAALIVRAVNAHEDLIAALEAIGETLAPPAGEESAAVAYHIARAALSTAPETETVQPTEGAAEQAEAEKRVLVEANGGGA